MLLFGNIFLVNDTNNIIRRNAVLYTLVENDVIISEAGVPSKITDGELWIYADGSTKSLGAEFETVSMYQLDKLRGGGNQTILMATLEPV